MRATFTTLRKSITHNAVTKIISFIIGYGLWTICAQPHVNDYWVTVPVCFYGPEKELCAPTHIDVHVSGKRHLLNAIDQKTLALHVDTATLHEGPNGIIPCAANLFLPDGVNVLHWIPSNSVVTVTGDQASPSLPETVSC